MTLVLPRYLSLGQSSTFERDLKIEGERKCYGSSHKAISTGEGDRFSKKSEEHDCPVEGNNGQMFTSEVAKLPALSRSCMVNGVLSTLEEHILLYPLSEEEEGVQSLALSDGVIEYACSELRLSGDERVKHYAVATLTTAIQQISKPTQHKGPTTSSCKACGLGFALSLAWAQSFVGTVILSWEQCGL